METWNQKERSGSGGVVYGHGPYGEGFYGGGSVISVQAVRVTEDNVEAVAQWCRGSLVEEIDPEYPDEMRLGINVSTPAGVKRASHHMYVIQYGPAFYVSHNRPFEMNYEPARGPAPRLESAGDARRQRGFADPFDTGRMGI